MNETNEENKSEFLTPNMIVGVVILLGLCLMFASYIVGKSQGQQESQSTIDSCTIESAQTKVLLNTKTIEAQNKSAELITCITKINAFNKQVLGYVCQPMAPEGNSTTFDANCGTENVTWVRVK